METIRTIAELDAKIAECDRAGETSEDAMRALLGGFRMETPVNLPRDPFDPAYREAQLELYERIVGRPYAPSNEVTKFDVDSALRRPFPLYTNSSFVAGEYFMAIGFVLQSMALPPGSRVLEFGAGWGWTSILLAQLGHKVTVIDIEPCFCELITRRAEKEGVEIEVINADFFAVEAMERQFDAVLFYDCFHHCDDHLRLLTSLHKVVTPEGRVFFGAEPIESGFPVPWGIRLDGWALWGVRKNGWMELGFRDDYFTRALARTGWSGRRIGVAGQNRQRIWEARRGNNTGVRFAANAPEIKTQIGRIVEGLIALDGSKAGTAIYGPYVEMPPGKYVARLGFRAGAARRGTAKLDVCFDGGRKRLAERRVRDDEAAELNFTLREDASDLEIRLFVERGFIGQIEFVEIVPAEKGSPR
jgi:SAM-dependent methyltransferase